VSQAAGIDFLHFDSATPTHYIQETMGSGLAWLDYDGDGLVDLFLVQDGPVRPDAQAAQPTCRLYRNNGDGTFRDVTQAVGLAGRAGYGMGCAVGDYDNDGWPDLVVTYLGGIALYHNEPDGQGGRRFREVTQAAGLAGAQGWCTSCAFGDVDGDGFPDLYVCRYVVLDLDHYPPCTDEHTGLNASCPPTQFPHQTHLLFHNNGNGTFTDVSESSGVANAPPAPGLAVVMVDLDGDGLLDIYVANDMKPAYLFHNQGGGRFVEKALLQGCGMGPSGTGVSGMCAEAGDIDNTGRPSLFVTNFYNRPNVLYRNLGNLFFQEWSNPSGLGPPSVNRLAFGAVFFDPDLDGNLDLAVANGHIHRYAQEIYGVPFGQEAQLFLGDGTGHFRDVSYEAGPYFRQPRVGRGMAWADYDNDGFPALVVNHNGGKAALLRNQTQSGNAWLRLNLVGDGKKSSRDAVGARVEVHAGGQKRVRWITGGGSYLSASDQRLLVGLGTAGQAERVLVTWPSGRKQEFHDLAARHSYRLIEGRSEPELVSLKLSKH
jgi:hypothetical protein